MQTFVVKLASGVAALIASLCLELSHISQNTLDDISAITDGTPKTLILRITMAVVPIIGLSIAAIYFHKKYILTDEKLDEISAQLKEINAS